MTIIEAIKEHGVYTGLRRRAWEGKFYIQAYEEYLWVYTTADHWKLAPWCPDADDLLAADWEVIE